MNGIIAQYQAREIGVTVWLVETNDSHHRFKLFIETPSSNPGSGTRYSDKGQALDALGYEFDRLVKAFSQAA